MYQQVIYDLMIKAYRLAIGLASPFNSKATKWIHGRKDWRRSLSKSMDSDTRSVIWVHAASLGEFEQGRPVIESLKQTFPEKRILLTFFSPSGYEIRKNYDKADVVTYLPLDTKKNAKDFIALTRPDLAIFIKYEFWFNHLAELKAKNIPVLLVAGRLHAKQGFFKPWGGYFRKGLSAFEHFFLQDGNSSVLLDQLGLDNYTVNGDTRFDRVLAIRAEDIRFSEIEDFCADDPVIILGSSWPYDEILMQTYISGNRAARFKVIIAPHEIDNNRIDEFQRNCALPCIRYSNWSNRVGDEQVMMIDSIGMLSHVYRYATVAMVGGGFGAGIHNSLEAAVWSKPIVFGPRYTMFNEAVSLVEIGAAFSVESQRELDEVLDRLLFSDTTRSVSAGQRAWKFCEAGQGASRQVVDHVKSLLKE